MITTQNKPFLVPLTKENFDLAEQHKAEQIDAEKINQVYYNTLAICAVKTYCKWLGLPTEENNSESRNFLLRTVKNVADLQIKGKGKLECRPVLPGDKHCYIPRKIWENRIGYVAVEIDKENWEAKLLGFLTLVETEKVPLNKLRSLDELIDTIIPVTNTPAVKTVNLSKWFEGVFEAGYQALSNLINPEQQLALATRESSAKILEGGRLIDLGMRLKNQNVALVIQMTPETENERNILVQLHPGGGNRYLPPNLKLVMVSKSGKILQEIQSRTQDNYVQLLPFKGKVGKNFTIEVVLDDAKLAEDIFVI